MESKELAKNEGRGQSDEHRRDEVEVSINNVSYQLHRGNTPVEELKRAGTVPVADQMVWVKGEELVDLPDDGSVVLKGGERFISHPRTSAAS